MLGRQNHRLFRITGVISLVFVLLMMIVQVYRAPPARGLLGSLSVVPGSGYPGTVEVEVSGSGWLPLTPIDICWDDCKTRLAEPVTTSALGTFSVEVTIPSDASPAIHAIYACQLVDCASYNFQVVANPSISTTTTQPTTGTTQATTTTTTRVATTTTQATTTTRPEPGSTTTPGAGSGDQGSGDASSGSPEAQSVAASDEVLSASLSPDVASNDPDTVSLTASEASSSDDDSSSPPNGLWSIRTPFVMWSLWLALMIVAGVLIALGIWLRGRLATRS